MPRPPARKRKTNTKAEKTRARLIEVATRLFREHGSDEVTVRRIAAAARIEAGSIYYHFDSREEILRAVLEQGIADARGEVLTAVATAGQRSPPLARLHAALAAHLKFTLRNHFSARLRTIRRLPKRLRERHMQQERDYAAIFTELLVEAERAGLLRGDLDRSVIRMLSLGALTWVAEWYDPAGPKSLDDIAREYMAILTHGIVKPGTVRTEGRSRTPSRS
jgi:AcrR family transcriptional regulator